MLEIDPKNVIREIGNFYNTLFSHPKENVELEVKNYVREFETSRSGRERDTLEKSVLLIQDAPESFARGLSSLNRNLSGVLEKLKASKNEFEKIREELSEFRMRNNLLINDPFSIERHEYLTAIEQSKRDYDNIMRQKEAELVKDYGTLMESALETAGVSLTSGPSNAYKGEFSVSRKY